MSESRQSFVRQFVDAAPYVVRMRGRHWVIWVDPDLPQSRLPAVAEEIALLHVLGARISLIVGDQPGPDLAPIDAVRAGEIGEDASGIGRWWIRQLSRGWVGIPDRQFRAAVVSANVVTARRAGVIDGQDMDALGVVRTVDTERVAALLETGNIIVQTAETPSADGTALVVPPLTLAASYAAETDASKLVLITCKDGLPDELPLEWHPEQLQTHASSATGRQQLVLSTMLDAIKNGVRRVHAVNGEQAGSVLLELISSQGSGLLVGQSLASEVVPLELPEITEVSALLSRYQTEGQLAPRQEQEIAQKLADYFVLKVDGRIVATGALTVFEQDKYGLVESVAVHPDFQGMGYGVQLLVGLYRRAQKLGLTQLYALTTHAQDWFGGFGFEDVSDDDELPKGIAATYKPARNSRIVKKSVESGNRAPD